MRTSAIVGLAAAAVLALSVTADAQAARPGCFVKAAEGTNTTEEGAKFQAFEAILQATDWGVWAAWMANGSTPGYVVDKPKYKCTKGVGLGFKCVGQTTLCKKA